jgi:hypothetical protein
MGERIQEAREAREAMILKWLVYLSEYLGSSEKNVHCRRCKF